MSIPTSGQLKFSDLQTEFGGSNPISLGEYYAGGGYVSSGTAGTSGSIPVSGNPLNLGKFYGSAAAGLLWGSRFLRPGNYGTDFYIRYLNSRFFICGGDQNKSAITYSTDSTATSWLTTSVENGPLWVPSGGPLKIGRAHV